MNEAVLVCFHTGYPGAESDPIADSNCQRRIRAGDPGWRCGEEQGVGSEDWGGIGKMLVRDDYVISFIVPLFFIFSSVFDFYF